MAGAEQSRCRMEFHFSRLGRAGNVVMSGHHNVYGDVFRDLSKLKEGDESSFTARSIFSILMTNIMIFPERWQDAETRWKMHVDLPTNDDR